MSENETENSPLATEQRANERLLDELLRETIESAEQKEEPPGDPRTETIVGLSRKLATTEMAMLAQAGLSPAQLIDFWAVEHGRHPTSQWAGVRGISTGSVCRNVREAKEEIYGEHDDG